MSLEWGIVVARSLGKGCHGPTGFDVVQLTYCLANWRKTVLEMRWCAPSQKLPCAGRRCIAGPQIACVLACHTRRWFLSTYAAIRSKSAPLIFATAPNHPKHQLTWCWREQSRQN
eukprot:4766639-Amphidinium_carterae.1